MQVWGGSPQPGPLVPGASAGPWVLLLDTAQVQAAVACCHAFVQTVSPGTEALIVTILPAPPHGLAAWDEHAAAGMLGAFTREAALEWAPRGIRVNSILRGARADDGDVGELMQAMRRWSSMTGQTLRLGG